MMSGIWVLELIDLSQGQIYRLRRLRREPARHRRCRDRRRHRDLPGRCADPGAEVPRPRARLLRDLRADRSGDGRARAGGAGRDPAPGRQVPADGAAADVPHVVGAARPRAVLRGRAPQGATADGGDARARLPPGRRSSTPASICRRSVRSRRWPSRPRSCARGRDAPTAFSRRPPPAASRPRRCPRSRSWPRPIKPGWTRFAASRRAIPTPRSSSGRSWS